MPRIKPPATVLIAHLRAIPEITGGMGAIFGMVEGIEEGGMVDIWRSDSRLRF